MDRGHYNCRDYYITPHFAAPTISSTIEVTNDETRSIIRDRPNHLSSVIRHESFDELEQRSRSPASQQPKFPFLRLPLELRQQVYNYLLPRTISKPQDVTEVLSRKLGSMSLSEASSDKDCPPRSATGIGPRATAITAYHIIWKRGNVKLLCVNRQIHDECADLIYGGNNTFLLSVTYAGIIFRYSWLLPSGLTPTKRYPFLELMPQRYLARLNRVVVCVEHVDAYTAMIKFNVGAQGLVYGLRGQVQKLVDGLLSPPSPRPLATNSEEHPAPPTNSDTANISDHVATRIPLAKMHVRVSTANSIVDEMKRNRALNSGRAEEDVTVPIQGLADMLEPLEGLSGVRDVAVTGAVPDNLARRLEETMNSSREVYEVGHPGTSCKCPKRPSAMAGADLSYRGIDGDGLRLFAYMNDLV